MKKMEVLTSGSSNITGCSHVIGFHVKLLQNDIFNKVASDVYLKRKYYICVFKPMQYQQDELEQANFI